MTFGTNGTLVSWVTPLRAMKVIHQWSIPLMNGQDYCILKPLTDRDLSPPKKHNFFNFTCFFGPLWWCLHFWCILAEGTIFPVSRLGSWWRTSGWTERWTEVTLQQNPQIYSKMKTTGRWVEWAEKIMEGFATYFGGVAACLKHAGVRSRTGPNVKACFRCYCFGQGTWPIPSTRQIFRAVILAVSQVRLYFK